MSPVPADERFQLAARGRLRVGDDQCVSTRRGRPSPYGPLQLWAKELTGGGVAVLLASREGPDGGTATAVTVPLTALPGGLRPESGAYAVRDLWKHAAVAGALADGELTMEVAPGASVLYRLDPL